MATPQHRLILSTEESLALSANPKNGSLSIMRGNRTGNGCTLQPKDQTAASKLFPGAVA